MSEITAIAVINDKRCSGTIVFSELSKTKVQIDVNLQNLTPGLHGFHIHETGNLEEGCKSCCAHFNPTNSNHGGPKDKDRHVGDLGNIKANSKGICKMTFTDSVIRLRGWKYNIIGRSVVIHEKEDDLGKGGDKESLKTGNAGARIGCAVIGYKRAHYRI